MMAKEIIAPEWHYPIIQFLIIWNTVDASVRDDLGN